MSIFTELLPKINQISQDFSNTFNESLKEALECFDKFEADFENVKKQTREKTVKDKTILTKLQSINEDVDENTTPNGKLEEKLCVQPEESSEETEKEDAPKRGSKKRSKNEVDDMSSPEVDKRQKRNASVVAKNNISKQDKENINVLKENVISETAGRPVNVNLTQKLRREDSADKAQTKSRKNKDDNKENTVPIHDVQIKQEKISIAPEPMEDAALPEDVIVKQEVSKDEIAMPPPPAPLKKTRKALKEKPDAVPVAEDTGRRRTRKQTETLPDAPVASTRTTRASSRITQNADTEDPPITKDARPKRTRGRKKASEVGPESAKDSHVTQDSGLGSPSEKPRPKRTRKVQKAAEKESKKETTKEKEISPKEEKSPILSSVLDQYKKNLKSKAIVTELDQDECDKEELDHNTVDIKSKTNKENEQDNKTKPVNINCTVVLQNGVYEHEPITPKNLRVMDQTVVIEKLNNETMVLDKPTLTMDSTVVLDKPILAMDSTVVLDKPTVAMDNNVLDFARNIAMNATVVIDKLPEPNVTEDNSLLTDDSDTPDVTPTKAIPKQQPLSAVKEKVQKFEELAARTTRTKTRAMAKKDDATEHVTPPDKISKAILSAENLSKMNNMIFNGKTTQVTSSASKPKSNIPTLKSNMSSSTSKLSGLVRAREAAEEYQRNEKEDARRKKEALLEARREAQRRKREDKMAAAAAAREVAERERRAALEAAARGRLEKQAHADLGKLEKLKEVERKKQEQARKLAEAEERRRAEEQARALRLAEEQRRAEAARKKQLEEAEAMKKEEVQMMKEVLQRQKEYNEKQKLKYNNKTPLKSYGAPCAMEPVYMADGFEFLMSDEDEEVQRPSPAWSCSANRHSQLRVQARFEESGGAAEVERLFSVRPQCPDLRQIFPNIDRARLKRTSSAVWRTPPSALR